MSGATQAADRLRQPLPVSAARTARTLTVQTRSPLAVGPRVLPFFGETVHDSFGYVQTRQSPAMDLKVSTFEDAYLLIGAGKDGVIIDADGHPIRETCFFTDVDLGSYSLQHLNDSAIALDQHLFLCLDGSWANYYHWTVLGLGRAMIYNRACPDPATTILFDYGSRQRNGQQFGFSEQVWRDSARFAGLDQNSRILADGIYKISTLDYMWQTVDQPPYISYFPSLYSGFHQIMADCAESGRLENIVVVRPHDPRMSAAGLEAARMLVDEGGFRLIDFATMTFSEQVSLLRNTNVIVAPHGAGLTNILYATPTTKIVELHKRLPGEDYLRPWFYLLAWGKNQQYTYVDLDACDDAASITNRITEIVHV